jgi:hypothetical protein
MWDFITKMFETPVGIVFMFILLGGVLMIAVILLKFLIGKLNETEEGPFGFKFRKKNKIDKNEETVKIEGMNGRSLIIPQRVYSQIMASFETSLDNFVRDRDNYIRASNLEREKNLEKCIQEAIQSVILNFNQGPSSSNGDRSILKLFLEAVFRKILISELTSIRDNPEISEWSDIQASEALSKVIDSVTKQMKNQSSELISSVSLSDADMFKFSGSSLEEIIKNTASSTIKTFMKLSRDEQDDLLSLSKKRTEKLREALDMIIGEDK